jgi:hypothetical protein
MAKGSILYRKRVYKTDITDAEILYLPRPAAIRTLDYDRHEFDAGMQPSADACPTDI